MEIPEQTESCETEIPPLPTDREARIYHLYHDRIDVFEEASPEKVIKTYRRGDQLDQEDEMRLAHARFYNVLWLDRCGKTGRLYNLAKNRKTSP